MGVDVSIPALLIALFAAFRCTALSRPELQAELVALRHQLAVLHAMTVLV